MKAIRFHAHGGPEVLKYEDAPEPVVRANDVLVRVKACALNRLDLWVRVGSPNVPIPLPHIPGSDVSGEIAQIGADVTTVRVGQKGVLAPGVTWWGWHVPTLLEAGVIVLLGVVMLGIAIWEFSATE